MISSVSWVSSSTRPPPLDGNDTAARRSHRDKRNLIRVLKATKTGPRRGSQHPAVSRPPTITGFRRQRATSPFSPEPGGPKGHQGLLGTRLPPRRDRLLVISDSECLVLFSPS